MKGFLLIIFTFMLVACTSAPQKTDSAQSSVTSASTQIASVPEEYSITSEIFDTLQRPLGFKLSSQLKPISRKGYEYFMAGFGWWDIYLSTGKKLGNGIYEKPAEQKSNCEIIELHAVKSEYESTVNEVKILFVSSDKACLEKLKNDFHSEAAKFFGNAGKDFKDHVSWESGWISYTSYDIKRHESGNWVYLVSSFDSANSLY